MITHAADSGGEEASGGVKVQEPPMSERNREHSPMLHLDLYNFECPEVEGSRYVLTSPRSLEACARCLVKPVELLSRNLSELVREAPGRSMRVAAGLCEVYEIDRQRKLRLCREERERIIREEKRRVLPPVLGSGLGSPPTFKGQYRNEPPASSTTEPPTSKSQSSDSLQRKRGTASTKTSSESAASSSYSGDSTLDRAAHLPPRARTLDTVSSLMGRSFSLGDLSHSPQTTKKVERIVREVKKRGIQELPQRDRKIAALMIAKHQEENLLNEHRYRAHLQWDTQRKRSELRKEQEHRDKQRTLLRGHRMWESQVRTRRSRLSLEELSATSLTQRKCLLLEENWREQAQELEKLKREKLERVKLEEKQKKIQQEHNLKSKEQTIKEAQEQEGEIRQEKLLAAQHKKHSPNEQQLHKHKGPQNNAGKLKHKVLHHELTQQESESQGLKRSQEGNLQRAQENLEQLLEKRHHELKERAQKEELQIQRIRQASERREKEHREHLQELTRAAERRVQHAAQVAEEVVQQKSRKAVQSRLEKEKNQRENKQRVQQSEDMKRQELLVSIERKLERSEQIFRDKRTVLDNARSLARASFHIREKVRAEGNTRTFDKMALEAELHASIEKK
ncbi:coiled-coil domain-containing protein 177 [Ascaphus truei]|uniref:coiled-coil domain-containing protein 177 n=1 Tax=Ascaphus truei TaxID=8439 RepID=UPI003F5AA458